MPFFSYDQVSTERNCIPQASAQEKFVSVNISRVQKKKKAGWKQLVNTHLDLDKYL